MSPIFDRSHGQRAEPDSQGPPAPKRRSLDVAAEFARPAPAREGMVHTETEPWQVIDHHDVLAMLCDKHATVRTASWLLALLQATNLVKA